MVPSLQFFSKQFFAPLSSSSAYLFTLIAFGVGFAVRPLGALIFGRLGDKIADTGYGKGIGPASAGRQPPTDRTGRATMP